MFTSKECNDAVRALEVMELAAEKGHKEAMHNITRIKSANKGSSVGTLAAATWAAAPGLAASGLLYLLH